MSSTPPETDRITRMAFQVGGRVYWVGGGKPYRALEWAPTEAVLRPRKRTCKPYTAKPKFGPLAKLPCLSA